jgi:hypothetical protein
MVVNGISLPFQSWLKSARSRQIEKLYLTLLITLPQSQSNKEQLPLGRNSA